MHAFRTQTAKISFVACFILFFVVLFFCFPVYNSSDDVFLLYLLDGGFGAGPSNLLHYNYVLHPGLTWVVKTLFQKIPDLNWYSVFLYTFHFVSCCIVLNILLLENRRYKALTIFGVVFSVFEVPFLLSPTFTNTALITGTAGFIMLLRTTLRNTGNKNKILISVLIILVSGMLRLHTLIPLMAISVPLIVYRILHKQFLLIYVICLSVLGVFVLEYFQQHYYENKITGWKSEEAYRRSAFSYINSPKPQYSSKYGTEIYLLNNGNFWDNQFLSVEKIQQIKRESQSAGFSGAGLSKDYVHWLLVNNRIYWLSLLIVFLTCSLRASRIDSILNLISLLILLILFTCLPLFQKLPVYLIPALILFYILLTTCVPKAEPPKISGYMTENNWVFIFGFAGLFCWGVFNMSKISRANREKNALFKCSWNELNAMPDKLFLVTDDGFPLDYFAVWDQPTRYPITNLLYKDLWLNNTYQPLFKKFSIVTVKDLANNPDIIFVGENGNEIKNYFLKVWGIRLLTMEEDKRFQCFEAWKFKF